MGFLVPGRLPMSMKYANCPTAVVNAPVDVVWRLLTEPAGWGNFYDVEITKVVPPGPAVVGQKIYGTSGPWPLRFRVQFEFFKIDPANHVLGFTVQLPFGISVREDMDCVPLNSTQCRVNIIATSTFLRDGGAFTWYAGANSTGAPLILHRVLSGLRNAITTDSVEARIGCARGGALRKALGW